MLKSISRITTISLAILMLLSFVLLASATPAEAAREPALISGTMVKEHYDGSSADSTYNYWIYRPESFDKYGEKLPLIVSLHGGNGTGTNLDQLHSYDESFCKYIYEGKTAPEAVVLMPQSPSGWWFGFSSEREVEGCNGLMELIEYVAYNNNIDKSRIYITGVSRGGVATFLMLRNYPDYFAAAMPIASATRPNLCAGIKTPIRIYHGRYDLQSDESHMGNSVIYATDVINDSGGSCELIILEGIGHSGQFVYYDTENYDAMEWLYSHRKTTVVADPLDSFSDVSASSWYAGSVSYVADNGIFSGRGDGVFDPSGPMSRAMVAQVLFNMDKRISSWNGALLDDDSYIVSRDTTAPMQYDYTTEYDAVFAKAPDDKKTRHAMFGDVSNGDWFFDAVGWATSNGISNGINGKFMPSRSISRQDFVTMLYRYAVFKEYEIHGMYGAVLVDHYVDGNTVSDYAKEAMSWAISNEIVTGYDDGTLRPEVAMTRAEAAVLMERMTKLMVLSP